MKGLFVGIGLLCCSFCLLLYSADGFVESSLFGLKDRYWYLLLLMMRGVGLFSGGFLALIWVRVV